MILATICCLCLIGVISGCKRGEHTSSGKTLIQGKIGFIAPITGKNSTWGKNGLAGIKTAIRMHVKRREYSEPTLVIEDNQNVPSLTRRALKKLVEEKKVSAILLMASSEATFSIIDMAKEYQIPILALISTHPDITQSKWISQLIFDDNLQATVAALFVLDELFIERVAVIRDNLNAHSRRLADVFSENLESHGGSAPIFDLPDDVEDRKSLIKQLKFADFEFLYMPLEADIIVQLERMARSFDWSPGVMVSDGVLSSLVLQFPDDLEYLQGMLATDIYSNNHAFTSYGRKVKKIFEAEEKDEGTAFSALGCEGASILLGAMAQCRNGTDSVCINEQLRSTRNFTGILGKISINNNGRAERQVFINRIDGKEQKFMVKIN